MKLADLPAVQQLSRAEKLELVTELWDQISAQPEDDLEPVSNIEAGLLKDRLSTYRANPESSLTLEEFKRQLAERL